MNPRSRRLRTRRRQARTRLTKLVCLHEPERWQGLPLPSGANWDPTADTLTWGHSIIRAQDIRKCRWAWKHDDHGAPLTPEAKEQLRRFMGPSLSRDLDDPKRPTWQERYYRRIES